MSFCSNCGQELEENAKFCINCGSKIDAGKSKRTTVYEGTTHKCPNCGEILKSFLPNCPACGYEIRGSKNVSAVRELAEKLEAIEAKRGNIAKPNSLKRFIFGQQLTKTDEQKISLIRSFAIPNTKEDLYEFLIMSKSNVDVDVYENDASTRQGDARFALSEAWNAKFEQAYQKAKLVFANDIRMSEIQAMYDSMHKSIRKAKSKNLKSLGIIWGAVIAMVAILVIITNIGPSRAEAEKKEVARLEAIVEEIEANLEAGKYKLALMNADSLDYSDGYNSDKQEKYWEIQREYWIDIVIDDAAKNGVVLERPINEKSGKEENKDEVEDIQKQSTGSEPPE